MYQVGQEGRVCKNSSFTMESGAVLLCQSIEIEGKVKATINVGELLSLKSTAVLVGNIVTGKIAIEPGANVVGNCQMHNSSVDIQPDEPDSVE